MDHKHMNKREPPLQPEALLSATGPVKPKDTLGLSQIIKPIITNTPLLCNGNNLLQSKRTTAPAHHRTGLTAHQIQLHNKFDSLCSPVVIARSSMADNSDSSALCFSHCVTLKLSSSNYLLWKIQFETWLNNQRLLGFVTGANPCPNATRPVMNGDLMTETPNPAFTTWVQNEQKIIGWLLGSISEDALRFVYGLHTSREVWFSLAKKNNRVSLSRKSDLQRRLNSVSKEGKTMAGYLTSVNQICCAIEFEQRRVGDNGLDDLRKAQRVFGFDRSSRRKQSFWLEWSYGGEEAWHENDYSVSDFGDEPRFGEPDSEPPDYSHEGELEENHERGSWHEETESQFSIGDGDHEIEAAHGELNHEDQFVEPYTYEEETDSLISLEETEHNGEELGYQEEYAHEGEEINKVERWEDDEPGHGDMEQAARGHTSHGYTHQTQSNQGNSCEQFDFQLLTFSGHKQGPKAYINWEREIEYWFRFHNIPKEERLAHAVNSLVGEAHSWWTSEELMSHYIKPILNWGDLKQRMYKEFVLRFHNQGYIPKRLMCQKITREAKKPIQVKEVQQSSIFIPSLELQGKSLQGKSSNSNSVKFKEPTCYRCHKRGHFAATCPDRVVIKSTSQEPKPALGEMSTNLVESSLGSFLHHLSLGGSLDSSSIPETSKE
ncbi:unnamed protein product [Arabidopsis halleri]